MLLILFPYKYTEFYHYLIEVDKIKFQTGTEVEIHDLSSLINKGWEKSFPAKGYSKSKKFNSLKDWKSRFNKLYETKKKLIIFNFLDINSFNSLLIHRYIKKKNTKIIRLGTAGVLLLTDYYNKKTLYYLKEFLNFDFFIRKIIFHLKLKTFHFIYKKFFALEEILLISGNKKQPITNLGKIEKEVKFHSLDFSKTLNERIKLSKKDIIFFDTPTPFYAGDYETMYYGYSIKRPMGIKEHYIKLNNFLKSVEEFYSSKVIIVPHPKIRGISNPYYNKNFRVDERVDSALKLVPKSKFIMCASASTVVAYAVANYKPIIFVLGDGFKDKKNSMIKNKINIEKMSNYLGCSTIDYSHNFKKFNLKVDKRKYDNYKYQFLTSKEISNKKNFNIILELIKY